MATVKVKLRPSTIHSNTGVIYYQVTHKRKTQHIATRLKVNPLDWNAEIGKLSINAKNFNSIQCRIDNDVELISCGW